MEALEAVPPCPEALAHVMAWFLDLHQARGSSGFGPVPISYEAIDAWNRLTGAAARPWEVALIRRLDQIWLGLWAKQRKRDTGRSPKPTATHTPKRR